MTAGLRSKPILVSICLMLGLGLTVIAVAQDDVFNLFAGKKKSTGETKISVTLEPTSAKAGDIVTLKVHVALPEGSHTYSMAKDFSGRTKILPTTLEGLTSVDEDFSSLEKPVVKDDPQFGQKVETYKSSATLTRRFKVTDPKVVQVAGNVKLTVCDADSCRPLDQKFSVQLGGPVFESVHPLVSKVDGQELAIITWTAKLSPSKPKPGEIVTLSFAAKLAPEYHTFALDQDPKNAGQPTIITVQNLNHLKPVDEKAGFSADQPPEEHLADGKTQRIYHKQVTFSRRYQVETGFDQSGFGASGLVSYQVCKTSCRPAKFQFMLGTVDPPQNHKQASATTDTKQSDQGLGEFLDRLTYRDVGGKASDSLALYVLYAFIGGMILNVMPCVLPVIAIKALSFAQQAGENRRRILLLNVAYSAGVIAVFLVLASLAAFAGLSWGGLFQKVGFNISMCLLVFAMALSLLGVYEIPLPGMIGAAAGSSQHKEGPTGAFMTGIFATLLATPCSGPFLGTTLGWSVKQPVPVIYLIWGMMGLGMAFPYLVFAVSPRAIKLLPKPGNWMITFKQVAGFVLLGTAVYLLSLVEGAYQMPTLVTILGLSFGLWMIGNLYDYSSPPARRRLVQVAAAVTVGAIGWFGFGLANHEEKLVWKKFEPAAVKQALAQGKPVIVDFTADWCLTCKVVEKTTLNTDATAELVKKYDIVPFKADWTDGSDEIRAVLDRLGSTSIPVLAVFSPDQPKQPTVLRDAWTKSALLDELTKVGERSRGTPSAAKPEPVLRITAASEPKRAP